MERRVLLALLLSLRLAFTALAGVALSFVAATALVSLLGYTFNSLVTLGLLLALGFVVTDAAGSAQAIVTRLRADAADAARASQDSAARVARGVLASAPDVAWLSFAHALVRDAVYDELAPSRRMALHERAGFRVVGIRERIGQHHGRWRDVVFIERRSAAV